MAAAWIEKKKGWLGGHKSQKRKPEVKPQPKKPPEDLPPSRSETLPEGLHPEDLPRYGVTYIPIRCPRCHTKEIKCYSSYPGIRYYYCKKCRFRFKAIEADG